MVDVMSGFTTVYIGFGSNVGNREQAVYQAVRAVDGLRDTRLVACAKLYESPALLTDDAPDEWDEPFINTVAAYHTKLSPQELLRALQGIESALGKIKRGHWGPREIDIDILAYGREVVDEEDLQIPHPFAFDRDFVLMPWSDIAPHYRHPRHGESVRDALYALEAPECRLFQVAAA
jgi:2-amino-4-hydroxy-6-hydroxymethyldihydropteridine diphosphokinase